MKIIDILNKIANGEEVPQKVKYNGIIYTRVNDYNTKEVIDYLNHNESLFQINDGFEYCFIKTYLDNEVEIIEEDKKIEKIEKLRFVSHCSGTFAEEQAFRNRRDDEMTTKINEIIDYLNRENK